MSYTSLQTASGHADGNGIARHAGGLMACMSGCRGLRGHDGKFGKVSDVLNSHVPEIDE